MCKLAHMPLPLWHYQWHHINKKSLNKAQMEITVTQRSNTGQVIKWTLTVICMLYVNFMHFLLLECHNPKFWHLAQSHSWPLTLSCDHAHLNQPYCIRSQLITRAIITYIIIYTFTSSLTVSPATKQSCDYFKCTTTLTHDKHDTNTIRCTSCMLYIFINEVTTYIGAVT